MNRITLALGLVIGAALGAFIGWMGGILGASSAMREALTERDNYRDTVRAGLTRARANHPSSIEVDPETGHRTLRSAPITTGPITPAQERAAVKLHERITGERIGSLEELADG